ncbi:TonB-dependent receptor [Sphingobacterium faecale]|uniref:TonB-dependent receptor n=1 Tax=Sphingobacterium faecale TaxID=2803775 RepID=A0ABS1R077_9SPHI|nr:TonB-dependent receptor [Sphingobacterium faecale]MBL1407664.1 TonB-dependent receptor [Sphingobacterium faecale]
MNKKNAFLSIWRKKYYPLIFLMGLLTLLSVSTSYAQETKKKITVTLKGGDLPAAIEQLRKQTDVNFYYAKDELKNHRIKAVKFTAIPLVDIVRELLKGTNLEIMERDNSISIRAKQTKVESARLNGTSTGGQVKTVNATVVDEDGLKLERVTVSAKPQANLSTSTDQNGMFILKLPEAVTELSFSLVGYKPISLSIASIRASEYVYLKKEQSDLEEVVVVGYGAQKKQSLVGAVETIKPSALKTTSSSFTSSFAGKIAGVVAVQKSGEPGADGANFWIRGVSSFAGNINPLIILDGVEINMQILNSIPPEVIDQFSVLKDATATALFGTRGANGVLVITTKNGKNLERMSINVRLEGGTSSHTQKMKMVDGVTYMNMFNEAIKAREINNNYKPRFTQDKIEGTSQGLNDAIFPNVNWYETLFKPYTHNENVNVNVTGGASKLNYFVNGSFFNENGLFNTIEKRYKNNINHRRYNLQSNVSANLTSTTTLGVKVNAIFRELYGPGVSSSNLYYSTLTASPIAFPLTFPALNGEDYTLFGTASGPYAQGYYPNPYADLVKGYQETFNTTTLGIVDLNQKLDFILDGLKFKALASFNNYSNTQVSRSFKPHYFAIDKWSVNKDGVYDYTLASMGEPGQTALSTSSGAGGERKFTYQLSLDYGVSLQNRHNINAMVLYHQNQYNNNMPGSSLLAVLPQREQGLAGRLTYNYRDTYFSEFNFGYNGSENFKKGNRFGFFPSIAAGYVISNEPFFENWAETVSLLKVRGSYGLVGNDKINARFPYITNVDLNSKGYTFGYDFNNTLSGPNVTLLGNEDAQWEIGKKANLGFELGIKNEFTLVADVFREDRSNIFMQRRIIPSHLGLGAILPYANIGQVRNQGVDFTLDYHTTISDDLSISTRGTFTYVVNKLLDRDEPQQKEPYLSEIGHPLNSIRGLVAEGLFASEEEIKGWAKSTYEPDVRPGDIKYRDLNGDNVIDDNDKMVIGNPTIPQMIYGFGMSVAYRKLGVSFNFQGTGKSSLMMADIHPFDKNEHNVMQFIGDNYWQESNPDVNALYPRLDNEANAHNRQNSTFWLRNASFIRLKDVELSYDFKLFRIYLAATNLFRISSFKNWDPELGGGSGLSYPLQRTARFGVQFNFN